MIRKVITQMAIYNHPSKSALSLNWSNEFCGVKKNKTTNPISNAKTKDDHKLIR